MKILLTGGSSLFGQAFIDLVKKTSHELYATYNKSSIDFENAIFLDITDKEGVKKIVKNLNPDIIIHAAAFTNVDKCEVEREKAYNVNVKGTENIARIAKKINAKLVYISTDYVFDGEKGFYNEEDKTSPINYYGLTKLEGEKVVKKICNDFIIARTSVIYGPHKKNFVTWTIWELKKKKEIKIIIDQWVSPTLNIDLAEQIIALMEKDEKGIFHTAGGERISRYDFVLEVAKIFDFNEDFVIPTKTKEMNWIAKRPKDSSLDVSKISGVKKPYKVKEALHLLKKEIQ